jgi:hypothetical protein
LIRAYATELLENTDTDADRSAALTRLLNHYPHSRYAAQVELKPRDRPIAPGSLRPGVTTEQFSDYKSALSWLSAERS